MLNNPVNLKKKIAKNCKTLRFFANLSNFKDFWEFFISKNLNNH